MNSFLIIDSKLLRQFLILTGYVSYLLMKLFSVHKIPFLILPIYLMNLIMQFGRITIQGKISI